MGDRPGLLHLPSRACGTSVSNSGGHRIDPGPGERAQGAASHVGNRKIAEYVIA